MHQVEGKILHLVFILSWTPLGGLPPSLPAPLTHTHTHTCTIFERQCRRCQAGLCNVWTIRTQCNDNTKQGPSVADMIEACAMFASSPVILEDPSMIFLARGQTAPSLCFFYPAMRSFAILQQGCCSLIHANEGYSTLSCALFTLFSMPLHLLTAQIWLPMLVTCADCAQQNSHCSLPVLIVQSRYKDLTELMLVGGHLLAQ